MKHAIALYVFCILAGIFSLAPLSGFCADNQVVVIPLMKGKNLKNVITVAQANGQFNDPVAAVNSIADAGVDNPYLVVIAPGVYTLTQTLVMKEYVNISGSGEKATILRGTISSGIDTDSAIVKPANNSSLSFLSIENKGGGTIAIGVYATGLDDTAELRQITVSALGTFDNRAIYNVSSSLVIREVTANAHGGIYNYGVYNASSSPAMFAVFANGSGGYVNRGVVNDASSPTMNHVTATASTVPDSIGVEDIGGSSPKIKHCYLQGTLYGLIHDGGTARVSQSTITGGAYLKSGTATCIASDNDIGLQLSTSNCSAP